MLWAGVLLLNVPSTVGGGWTTRAALGRFGLTVLSPAFMLALFYGQMHGIVTDSAKLRHEKYGKDPEFVEYVRKTPFILPFIPPPQTSPGTDN